MSLESQKHLTFLQLKIYRKDKGRLITFPFFVMSELTKKHIIDLQIKHIIDLQIMDDGTMDTVVYDSISRKTFRYDSEFRFSFKDDESFLKEIEEEILEEQIRTIDF